MAISSVNTYNTVTENETDMKLILQVIKTEGREKPKFESGIGINFDMEI